MTSGSHPANKQEWYDALDRAARYYRQALKEIIEDCGHDKPDIDKILGHAQTGIFAADHELKQVKKAAAQT